MEMRELMSVPWEEASMHFMVGGFWFCAPPTLMIVDQFSFYKNSLLHFMNEKLLTLHHNIFECMELSLCNYSFWMVHNDIMLLDSF